MAPLFPLARDMGMYSLLHRRLFDRSYTHHKLLTGPIANRTRSRTLKAALNTPQPSPGAPAGRFTPNPKPLSHTALRKASHKLRTTRIRLARSIDQYRDDKGRLKPSLREKYHQLGTNGVLPPVLPQPRPASWDSEARMRRKLRPHKYTARLSQMEKNWSERELEEEFGLLPREEKEGEEAGLLAELDVEEFFTGVGRCMEDMMDGYCVGGIWRKLKEVERVRLVGCDWGRGGVVMDARCVEIVKGVRGVMGVE